MYVIESYQIIVAQSTLSSNGCLFFLFHMQDQFTRIYYGIIFYSIFLEDAIRAIISSQKSNNIFQAKSQPAYVKIMWVLFLLLQIISLSFSTEIMRCNFMWADHLSETHSTHILHISITSYYRNTTSVFIMAVCSCAKALPGIAMCCLFSE